MFQVEQKHWNTSFMSCNQKWTHWPWYFRLHFLTVFPHPCLTDRPKFNINIWHWVFWNFDILHYFWQRLTLWHCELMKYWHWYWNFYTDIFTNFTLLLKLWHLTLGILKFCHLTLDPLCQGPLVCHFLRGGGVEMERFVENNTKMMFFQLKHFLKGYLDRKLYFLWAVREGGGDWSQNHNNCLYAIICLPACVSLFMSPSPPRSIIHAPPSSCVYIILWQCLSPKLCLTFPSSIVLVHIVLHNNTWLLVHKMKNAHYTSTSHFKSDFVRYWPYILHRLINCRHSWLWEYTDPIKALSCESILLVCSIATSG